MKLEEYEALKQTLTAENAPVVLEQIFSNLKEDITERDSLAESIASKDAKIKDLQDTNMKLFLSIGKAADDPKDPEDEEAKFNEEVENEIANILGGK